MQAATDCGDRKKRTSGTDLYIASRVRLARKLAKLSQEQVAKRLGITFQQIQKYETGINRLSASRLYEVSLLFGQPVSFFLPPSPADFPPVRAAPDFGLDRLMELMSAPETSDLLLAYLQIKDAKIRRHVVALARSIANGAE